MLLSLYILIPATPRRALVVVGVDLLLNKVPAPGDQPPVPPRPLALVLYQPVWPRPQTLVDVTPTPEVVSLEIEPFEEVEELTIVSADEEEVDSEESVLAPDNEDEEDEEDEDDDDEVFDYCALSSELNHARTLENEQVAIEALHGNAEPSSPPPSAQTTTVEVVQDTKTQETSPVTTPLPLVTPSPLVIPSLNPSAPTFLPKRVVTPIVSRTSSPLRPDAPSFIPTGRPKASDVSRASSSESIHSPYNSPKVAPIERPRSTFNRQSPAPTRAAPLLRSEAASYAPVSRPTSQNINRATTYIPLENPVPARMPVTYRVDPNGFYHSVPAERSSPCTCLDCQAMLYTKYAPHILATKSIPEPFPIALSTTGTYTHHVPPVVQSPPPVSMQYARYF